MKVEDGVSVRQAGRWRGPGNAPPSSGVDPIGPSHRGAAGAGSGRSGWARSASRRARSVFRGGEVVLGTVGPGEFAGETGVVEGRPCSATVSTRPAQLEREHGRR